MGYYYKRDEEKMSICSIYKSVSCLRKKKKWNYFVITVLYSTVQSFLAWVYITSNEWKH